MTISKEKFEQIALEVAKDHWHVTDAGDWYFGTVDNAYALIKRLEDDVGRTTKFCADGSIEEYIKLPIVELPIIGEE